MREWPSSVREKRTLPGRLRSGKSYAKRHNRSANRNFSNNTASWMRLIHPLNFRASCTASDPPLVVMVLPTRYRNSNHFVPCIMRGKRRFTQFRNLPPNPLMRSGPVEVQHIPVRDTLQLFLVKDQHVGKRILVLHFS